MACVECGRGFHDECISEDCNNCHPDEYQITQSITATGSRKGMMGAPMKDPETIGDPYSTGRKRAAIQYPLFKTNPCEWRGKKNCGGGLKPIIGCTEGKQAHRHHGPVKNPLRNEPGNVHRICANCHNHWHTENDPQYDEQIYNGLPHNPEPADELELLANETMWKLRK